MLQHVTWMYVVCWLCSRTDMQHARVQDKGSICPQLCKPHYFVAVCEPRHYWAIKIQAMSHGKYCTRERNRGKKITSTINTCNSDALLIKQGWRKRTTTSHRSLSLFTLILPGCKLVTLNIHL
jgi:hypothetical protein